MILYLGASTAYPDLMIDFIEVRLKSGILVSLNWDYSEIMRTEKGFDAIYKGVYFDEEYAAGKLQELKDVEITYVQIYSERKGEISFSIDEMEFWDNYESLPYIPPPLAESYQVVFD